MTSRNHEFRHPLNDLMLGLTTDRPWSDAVRRVTRMWVQSGEATSAVVFSPTGLNTLELTTTSRSPASTPVTTNSVVQATAAALLDQPLALELLSHSHSRADSEVHVELWPELAAGLLVMVDASRRSEASEGRFDPETLVTISRRILQRATDRPVLLPDAELLEAMAEFAAGAGHEINNPLATIIGQSQLLLRSDPPIDQRQALETIGAQAWRIRDMIGNAMLFARPPKLKREPLDLVQVARDALVPLQSFATEAGCRLHVASANASLALEADRTQLSVLIAQLVRNSLTAIRSSEHGDQVTLTLQPHQDRAVSLSVIDNGPGITSPEVRRHLFNPFYSGRSAGRGLGFGLCLAWQITRMHHGILFHESPPNGGTAFHVILP